ncbi:MAG: class I SAM-dependent methyltransferase [Candidatus Saccharibacteria bacterium]
MSEDLRQITIDTYNHSADKLADYFAGFGSRVTDIDRAFELAGNPVQPTVLEIGCGDGRDAKEIVRRTPHYLGMDLSEELIKIARRNVPEGQFEVADMADYEYPPDIDIAFAFASLLHLNKSEVRTVLSGLVQALRPNGIFYISSKYRPEYAEEVQDDQFGRRLFYYYNADLIQELAGPAYGLAGSWESVHGHTTWFEMALRKL